MVVTHLNQDSRQQHKAYCNIWINYLSELFREIDRNLGEQVYADVR